MEKAERAAKRHNGRAIEANKAGNRNDKKARNDSYCYYEVDSLGPMKPEEWDRIQGYTERREDIIKMAVAAFQRGDMEEHKKLIERANEIVRVIKRG